MSSFRLLYLLGRYKYAKFLSQVEFLFFTAVKKYFCDTRVKAHK